VVLALAVLATAGTDPAGAVTHRAPTTASRSVHVAYAGCAAKDVELTVTLSARSYGLGQNVHYLVRLHNLSAKACSNGTPAHPELGPPALQVGPCSAMPLSIENVRGTQVFPDSGAFACPALLGPPLTPHGTLRATGTWDRVEGAFGPAHVPKAAPVGRYRLAIGRLVSVPFALTDAAPTADLSARVGRPPTRAVERTAHAPYGGCPAHSVTVTATIAPPVLAHAVVARVTVHNDGADWCGPRRTTGSLDIGPCGSLAVVVRDATGVDVFPGNEVFFCPAYDGRGVAPHASVTGIFEWAGEEDVAPQDVPARWRQAGAGRYSLDVAGVLEVPFTLGD
jgi:hypothetical protein